MQTRPVSLSCLHASTSALLAVSLLSWFASCARTDGSGTRDDRVSLEATASDSAEKAELLARLRAAMQREYVAIPGEREFSGRMIARPLQRKALAVLGHDEAQSDARRQDAHVEIARFRVVGYVSQTDEYLFEVPAGSDENRVARELLGTLLFQYVEPDWTLYPIACPNDTLLANQWHHNANRMRSCDAWGLHTGNPTVAVGICDTGILTTHEDLLLHRLEGYNAVDQVWESAGGNIGPVHPHGTQTTGCAAANGDNGKGVSGVGWNLSHRMMRVSNVSTGSSSQSTLQHAARTAVENGCKVASVSYSGVDSSSNLTTATYIKSIGGLLVWAAGNDNRNLTLGNRDADDIIVAGATDSSDLKASFSAYGTFVDVVAPGVSVATTGSGSTSQYVSVSGTSFACPLTAGLCALIWSANPALTPNEVETILKQSCDDLGTAGIDNTFGYGRINSYEAMVLAAGGGGSAPVADFAGTPVSGDAPLVVAFTDLSSNAPTSWSWSFGDGGTSTAQHPSHTYTTPGSYTVTLTASNAFGSDAETKSAYITVSLGGGTEQEIALETWESNSYSGGTGWSGAWTRSGDVSIRTDGPHAGARHARLRSSTGLLRRTVDLTGVTDAKLVFWARIRSFENGDQAFVRVSTNGSTFTTVKTFVNGDDDNVYHQHQIALGTVSSTVVIEFDAQMSSTSDYVYLDDIEIRGVR